MVYQRPKFSAENESFQLSAFGLWFRPPNLEAEYGRMSEWGRFKQLASLKPISVAILNLLVNSNSSRILLTFDSMHLKRLQCSQNYHLESHSLILYILSKWA